MKKTIFGFLITALVLTTAFALASCSNNQMSSTEKRKESTDFSNQRNSQTAAIIDAYHQIKKGLAAEDSAKAAEGAKAMGAAFEKFDSTKLSESQRKEYSEILESAKEHAEHIVKSGVDHQKEHFEEMAKDIKDLFALVGADKKG